MSNFDNNPWTPTDRPCPECGQPEASRGWWDDSPENGGACIGEQRTCTNDACEYWEDL